MESTMMRLAVWHLPLLAAAIASTLRADDWPQWRGPTRDGMWHEEGVVAKFDSPQLEIRWRAPIASGYSGPTVAEGRVFVTDRVTEPKQAERVHAFDAATGQALWMHEYDCTYHTISYDAGPRAAVAIDEGRAYSLGSMGHLFCLDAAQGTVLWQHDLDKEYQIRFDQLIWGVSASPLVEGDLVIVQVGGQGETCLVAFDKVTGEERWRALEDRASYAAPILIQQAGKPVLVCWTGDSIAGLDPATGKVHWREPFAPRRMVLAVSTPVVDRDRLFVTGFYDGAMMLRLARNKLAVEPVWRKNGRSEQETEAIQSIISTPWLLGDYVYGVDSYGELRCLDAKTGERIWEDLTAVPNVRWGTIHMVKNGERMWMFNELGELIIAQLSPSGFEEISRAKLIEPTTGQLAQRGGVCWSHPAYANQHVFARNDKEIVAADLSAP
jgi:outer membrane protein assembly factor BamB